MCVSKVTLSKIKATAKTLKHCYHFPQRMPLFCPTERAFLNRQHVSSTFIVLVKNLFKEMYASSPGNNFSIKCLLTSQKPGNREVKYSCLKGRHLQPFSFIEYTAGQQQKPLYHQTDINNGWHLGQAKLLFPRRYSIVA